MPRKVLSPRERGIPPDHREERRPATSVKKVFTTAAGRTRWGHSVTPLTMNAAYLTSAAVLISTLSSMAQSISIDFNTPGQLANDFNVYQNATPGAGSPYVQSPIGGIG